MPYKKLTVINKLPFKGLILHFVKIIQLNTTEYVGQKGLSKNR